MRAQVAPIVVVGGVAGDRLAVVGSERPQDQPFGLQWRGLGAGHELALPKRGDATLPSSLDPFGAVPGFVGGSALRSLLALSRPLLLERLALLLVLREMWRLVGHSSSPQPGICSPSVSNRAFGVHYRAKAELRDDQQEPGASGLERVHMTPCRT